MYSVSEEYKTQIEYARRNPSHIKILFGLTDPDAPGASTITDNGSLLYSNTGNIDLGYSVASPYVTLEPLRWKLNGLGELPVPVNYTYQGYTSSIISDASGVFSEQPVITIEFSTIVFFPGISFVFDDVNDDYPTEIAVKFYKAGTQILAQTIKPDASNYVWAYKLPAHDKMTMSFVSTSKPYRRVRVFGIVYGLLKTFTEKNLVSCEGSRTVDPISAKLPTNNLNFTVFDTKQDYNPENPKGVWEYLDSGQSVRVQLGYELDSGIIEWVPWCSNFSTGDISVSSSGVATRLTISTVNILNFMEKKYTYGKYYPEGRTLAELVEDLMMFAGMPGAYTVDATLRTLRTKVPLPVDSVGKLLQLIANAGMCVLDVDRGGQIQIVKEHSTSDNFDLNLHKQFRTPEVNKYPLLKGLKVGYTRLVTPTGTPESLVDAYELASGATTTVELGYNPSRDQTYTTTGSLIIQSIEFFAEWCSIVYSGTGTISVQGVTMDYKPASIVTKYADIGADTSMYNVLIDNADWAAQYNAWVAKYYNRRVQYATEHRGYPEMDLLDRINLASSYNNNLGVTVLETSIKYNGAIRGTALLLGDD